MLHANNNNNDTVTRYYSPGGPARPIASRVRKTAAANSITSAARPSVGPGERVPPRGRCENEGKILPSDDESDIATSLHSTESETVTTNFS